MVTTLMTTKIFVFVFVFVVKIRGQLNKNKLTVHPWNFRSKNLYQYSIFCMGGFQKTTCSSNSDPPIPGTVCVTYFKLLFPWAKLTAHHINFK